MDQMQALVAPDSLDPSAPGRIDPATDHVTTDDPLRRPGWSEAKSRVGWDLSFTVAGGRFRSDDPLKSDAARERRLARYVSQACFASSIETERAQQRGVALWSAICRKVLQRGKRPPIPDRASEVLLAKISAAGGRADGHALDRAVAGPRWTADLADEYELDATYERPLWENLERVAPGLRRWLVPQAPLEALAGHVIPKAVSERWVDFLYCPPWRDRATIVEIDGPQHRRRQGADAARDAALRASGLLVRRYEGRDTTATDGRLLEFFAREGAHLEGGVPPTAALALHGPATLGRLGLALVEAVVRGYLRAGEPWSLEVADELDVAEDLIGAALDPLRAVSDVWGLGVVPDDVWVNGRRWSLEGSGPASRHESGGYRAGKVAVRILLEPTTPYFARLPDVDQVPRIVVRGVGIPVNLDWLPAAPQTRPVLPTGRDISEPLHSLLRDLFGHDDFRPGQLQALRQTLTGRDSVVLLPTGSGKSLIYQLGGLLLPGTTLVVDPLISLINDQTERLEGDGIDRVVGLHAAKGLRPRERDAELESVASGGSLFAFVTPERLQSQRFRDHLGKAAERQLIGLTVVDEAHCVSEWGHDFRTAYLRLARNLRRRCAAPDGSPPPMLAMTGTASPAVLRDVLRELEIDPSAPGALQRPETHDRPNLHYVIRPTDEVGWMSEVVRSITDVIPLRLGTTLAHLATSKGRETDSGIVFAPHVNGKHGLDPIRDAIHAAFRAHELDLRIVIYSGKPPKGVSRSEWNGEKGVSEREFKSDVAPLLVGTKAFGMGIDKPNIRYTVHAGFPSSVEAFAQEAGRAGRDGKDSVCVLVAALPRAGIADRLLDPLLSAETRNRHFKGVGANAGGDLGRQGYFLTNSFPGEREETEAARGVFAEVRARGGRPGGTVTLPSPNTWQADDTSEDQETKQSRALFRLAMVGVIDDITKDAGETTVYLAAYDVRSIDRAFLAYVSRVEPGAEQAHRQRLTDAPANLDERIGFLLGEVIAVVYKLVALARVEALRFMHRLASGPVDEAHIRREINAYLGEGPVASVLSEAVAGDGTGVNVHRFILAMDAVPVQDREELVAASARQLEAYPQHPLILMASALGEARSDAGDEDRFISAARRSLDQLAAYQVSPADRVEAVSWLVKKLHRERPGRRSWARHVLRAWYSADYPDAMVEPVEDAVLEDAAAGDWDPESLEIVRHRRMARHAGRARELVSALAMREEGPDLES